MGINSHAFNFVMCQAARAPLGRVLTIGRQSLDVDQKFLRSKLGKPVEPSPYCEPVLLALGATSVDSLDVSDYENATIVLDLGKPCCFNQRFDTIIDFGSLEHIFDAATAFRNLVDLCEIGGRIIIFCPSTISTGTASGNFPQISFIRCIAGATDSATQRSITRRALIPERGTKCPWRSPACASRLCRSSQSFCSA